MLNFSVEQEEKKTNNNKLLYLIPPFIYGITKSKFIDNKHEESINNQKSIEDENVNKEFINNETEIEIDKFLNRIKKDKFKTKRKR
jgi:hypothetical protein